MTEDIRSNPAGARIVAANEAVLRRCPFDYTRDMDDSRRGFLGTADDPPIRDAEGRVVRDLDAYGFLEITLDERALRTVLLGSPAPAELPSRGAATVEGDPGGLIELLGHLDAPDPDFAIVTP
ncbi:alkyl sulfatase C-terminal domain-containing protein [Streptomyces sp. NPDC052225]|uniref:alkyl sulfatase C-terminal domain-containing protein n=1 Tax=Streptomyces sp. NPDC052225 TaxID=3154949 RepID=UPI003426C775